jgi:glycosidase
MTTRSFVFALAACASAFAFERTALGQATTVPQKGPLPEERIEPFTGPAPEGWWNDAVFYEVFVRSFADSTRGPLAGDGVGDLRGLIERLDYLNDGDPGTDTDLGVTALWLMPISPSPSYHGYDVTDYTGINPQYGTKEDFLDLMEACRTRGIRVILDLVLNHCAAEHPWFKAAAADPADPKRGWFIWRDQKPGYRGPWNQEVWHPVKPRDAAGPFFYGCFGRHMPDLDYTNPEVTREAFAIADFWLKEARADGFRLDAIRHLVENGPRQDNTRATHDWLKGFYRHCRSACPDAFLVGEVWSDHAAIAPYIGDKLDSCFDFPLAQAILDALNRGAAAPLAATAAAGWSAFPRNTASTFITNHDQPRAMTALKNDPARARLAAGLLLTLPGVPFLYYGEEIGMRGDKPDPAIRTPMRWDATATVGFTTGRPWSPLSPDDGEVVNVAAQSGDGGSLLSAYRRLVRLRLGEPALRRGDFTVVPSDHAGVFAFARSVAGVGGGEGEGATLLVVANMTGAPVRNYGLALERALGARRAARVEGAMDLLSNTVAGAGPTPVAELAARGMVVLRLR